MSGSAPRSKRLGDGHAALTTDRLDVQALSECEGDERVGATVVFVGTVRGVTDGVETSALSYEAHGPLATAMLESLRAQAIGRFGLMACTVVHRLGIVRPGEASVVIAAASPHRRDAFAAAEWLMEAIKREVPIWKGDERPDGGWAWSHPEAIPSPGGGA